jgi:hypothetical protein
VILIALQWLKGLYNIRAVLQMSQSAPQIYNLPQLHRQMIEVLGVKNADKLVPTKEDIKPADPISENMNALVGKPMRAFIYQDHDAHIATHMSFMQDPMVAQLIGQNPQAKQIMASLQAHIAEHLGFNYRKQMEEKLGAPLPPPNEELPEEVEVNLARLVADAGKQLTQEHQQEAAQRAAQAKAQDPIVQMQQQELKLKAAEVQRKSQKDAVDAQLKAAELQRKTVKDKADIQMDQAELAIDAKKEKAKMKEDKRRDNLKTGMELLERYGKKPTDKKG